MQHPSHTWTRLYLKLFHEYFPIYLQHRDCCRSSESLFDHSVVFAQAVWRFFLLHPYSVALPYIHEIPNIFSSNIYDCSTNCRKGDRLCVREEHVIAHKFHHFLSEILWKLQSLHDFFSHTSTYDFMTIEGV